MPDSFQNIRWSLEPTTPVIQPPMLSPILADPTFLLPEESIDRTWHLFAHSIHGVHHYTSSDGFGWAHKGRILPNAMRAFIHKEDDTFFLLYEKTRPFALYLAFLPMRWHSTIEVRTSKDLRTWSKAQTLLAPSLRWHKSEQYGEAVSNPCLVKVDQKYFLYYSASLVRVEDCGFNEPANIGLATADSITGPYHALPDPLRVPEPSSRWFNLGAGSIKVRKSGGSFVGLQNGIYTQEGVSGSAILALESADGKDWHLPSQTPILQPQDGWMKSHVYACDFKRAGKDWVLYFNARDDWHWTRGKECIGRMVGKTQR